MRKPKFGGAQRIVVKIGSAVLRADSRFDRVAFTGLVRDLAMLRAEGLEVVVVCSGAIGLGLAELGWDSRPSQMSQIQALAAIGQSNLMRQWTDELGYYNIVPGQVLLTHDDLRNRGRYLAARHTLQALLDMKVLPIINENDTIAIDEIKMGDNDSLASQMISLVGGSMLVLLSDVDGLYAVDPRTNPKADPLDFVDDISDDLLKAAGKSVSGLGSGGMWSKVQAVMQVKHLGVASIIANGKSPNILRKLYDGEQVGTWFQADSTSLGARKHWIAYALQPTGLVRVDSGAEAALIKSGRSLLSIGVIEVCGNFTAGDLISICGAGGEEFARGLVSHDAEVVAAAVGLRSGEKGGLPISDPAVVHRTDLVILP